MLLPGGVENHIDVLIIITHKQKRGGIVEIQPVSINGSVLVLEAAVKTEKYRCVMVDKVTEYIHTLFVTAWLERMQVKTDIREEYLVCPEYGTAAKRCIFQTYLRYIYLAEGKVEKFAKQEYLQRIQFYTVMAHKFVI